MFYNVKFFIFKLLLAYISCQSLLKYGKEAKESQLTAQLWLMDTESKMGVDSPTSNSNNGLLSSDFIFYLKNWHRFHILFQKLA